MLKSLDRPVPVVAQHGLGRFTRRPAHRPDVLPTLPEGFERFAPIGGQGAVWSLDRPDAVLGLNPGPAETNGGASRAAAQRPPELGTANGPALGLRGRPSGSQATGLALREPISLDALAGEPTT
eukprot:13713117-Alexandrium_andersonii.AAC.1